MKKIQFIIGSLLLLAVFSTNVNAQLVVNTGNTPSYYVQNVLLGGGVTATNITFSGSSGQIGEFSNGNATNLGLDHGIIMSSGNVTDAAQSAGTNASTDEGGGGDANLESLTNGYSTHDAALLEFDFVPLSSHVQFRYVFGSEEYPEYVGAGYNDAFGFFLTGPNPNGGNYNATNIALIPNTTTPVTIDNVNDHTNSQYYIDNQNGSSIVYDGFTTVLVAEADVVPCQTYHIKIGVADAGDHVYDSAVFLEANSFSTDAVTTNVYFSSPGVTATTENCVDAIVSFVLNNPAQNDVTITITYQGTATNGTDYNTLPSQVVIPAGSDSTSITVHPVADGITEGTEYIQMIVQTNPCSADTVTIAINDEEVADASYSISDNQICDGDTVTFNYTGSGSQNDVYNWDFGSGSNVISGSGQGPYTVSYTGTGTVQTSLNVDNGCATDNSSQDITIYPIPTSDFTVTTPICAGDISDIVYTGTGNSNDTYIWDFDGGTVVSGSGAGPYQVTWNTPGVYNVTLTVVSAYGCQSTTTVHQVMVVSNTNSLCCVMPHPDAGPDNQVCGLHYQMQGSAPAPGNTIEWLVNSQPGGAVVSFSDVHDSTAIVSVSQEGTYTFEWHEISGNCDSSDFVTITFYEQPNANAGEDGEICGLTYNLHAIPSINNSTGSWSVISGGTATFTNQNSPTTQVSVNNYGDYEFAWIETNNICSDTDTVVVSFLTQPTPFAGNDTSVCGNSVHLVSSSIRGYWTGPAGSIYDPSYMEHDVVADVPPYSTNTVTYPFVWHEDNGVCEGTDTVMVTFISVPFTEAGVNLSTCDLMIQLNADTIGSNITTAQWTSSLNGVTFDDNTIPNAVADISTLVPSVYGDSGEVGVWFYWNAYNSLGCGNTDSVLVTFYQVPQAYAGEDDSICGLHYDLQAELDLSNYASQGQWGVASTPAGATVQFINDTIPHSGVDVSTYGTYIFTWTEWNRDNNQCRTTDSVTIEFLEVPNIDAGNDTSVCGQFIQMHATSASGVGLWEVPGGTAFYDTANGNIDNSQQTNPYAWIRYSGLNDSVTFYWREYNGICVARDSVTVYFAADVPAVSYFDPADSTNCGLTMLGILDAQEPTYGVGYWVDTVPNTSFIENTHHVDTTIVSYYGMHHFYWIVKNGACIDTSAVAAIRFIEIPDANVGEYYRDAYGVKKDTACGHDYYLHAQPTVGVGKWYTTDSTNTYFTSTGHGYGINNEDTIHSNILNYNDTPPYRDVYWIVDNDGCVAKDTLRLLFAPIPTGEFTSTIPYCIGYDSYIEADVYTGSNNHPNYGVVYFNWDFGNGVVDSMNAHTLDSSNYVEVHWPWTGDTMHLVSLITENIFGCHSSIRIDTVHEPPMMVPDYDEYWATCGYPNGTIVLSTNNHQYTFWWDTTSYNGFVNPLNDSVQTALPGNNQYTIYVIGESQSPDAASVVPRPMCTDTLRVWLADTGHTVAMFDTNSVTGGIAPYQVSFVNQSINGMAYQWYIYNSNNEIIYSSEEVNPVYTFEDEGYYRIVLISISPEGCMDTLNYGPIYVESESFIKVPNVFTPNGDGVSDYFQVYAKTLSEFSGVIFDRWGRKIYEWDKWQNETDGWDGKIGNSLASPGVYYYLIKAKGKDGKDYDLKGDFYLMRSKK